MKTIFITGGSAGIGLALAKLYAENNWAVGICSRDRHKLANDLHSKFPSISYYQADVTDKNKLEIAINDFVIRNNNRLDVIIANAGRSSGSKASWPDYALVQTIVDINLTGTLNTFAIASEIFKKQGCGHLVAIASIAGFVGLPGAAAYACSKAAVLTLCESLAIDMPQYGIKVTAIAPGFVDTPLTQKNDHKMPLLMKAEKAALKIKKAIDKDKVLYIFPWQMRIFITIARLLPRYFYRWLMRLKIFNYSRGL